MGPRLIALTGPMGHGKSTVASILETTRGYTRTKFAAPLKLMLEVIGITQEEQEAPSDARQEPHPLLCGKSIRHAQQSLGTDWGRRCLGEEFWSGIWKRDVEELFSKVPTGGVVVDDLRFESELAAVRSLGGVVWRVIDGRKPIPSSGHESEMFWRLFKVDGEIRNDGSYQELSACVTLALLASESEEAA